MKAKSEVSQEKINSTEQPVSLDTADSGQWVKIFSIPAGLFQAQFLRFGINKGERVRCIERLPGGTIVIQKNRQQIAVGDRLAKQIFVVIVGNEQK